MASEILKKCRTLWENEVTLAEAAHSFPWCESCSKLLCLLLMLKHGGFLNDQVSCTSMSQSFWSYSCPIFGQCLCLHGSVTVWLCDTHYQQYKPHVRIVIVLTACIHSSQEDWIGWTVVFSLISSTRINWPWDNNCMFFCDEIWLNYPLESL